MRPRDYKKAEITRRPEETHRTTLNLFPVGPAFRGCSASLSDIAQGHCLFISPWLGTSVLSLRSLSSARFAKHIQVVAGS